MSYFMVWAFVIIATTIWLSMATTSGSKTAISIVAFVVSFAMFTFGVMIQDFLGSEMIWAGAAGVFISGSALITFNYRDFDPVTEEPNMAHFE